MSARDFSKVSPLLWRSGRFMGLSDRGKICHLYFLTNAHVPSCGIYFLPDGYACADLDWSLETYEATRAELVDAGLVDFDPVHSVVLVERWFKHNPPTNDDHAKGTTRWLNDIESTRLREKALAGFLEANERRLAAAEAKARQKLDRVKELGSTNGISLPLRRSALVRASAK